MALPDSDTILQPASLTTNQRRFLACFAASGSVLKAARWSKIHRQSHYVWMAQPDYQRAFEATQLHAARMLEDEAVRRAHDGVKKPIRYKGRIIAFDTEYSDTLLIQLLKANNPEKFRERTDTRITGPDGKSVMGEFEDLINLMRRGA